MSGQFDKAPEKPEYPTPDGPLFSELAGMDEAVAWGRGLAADIKLYKAGKIPWEQIDAGLVVHGPPGTGKTTFARALAAETRLPLIATSYADIARGHIYAGPIMEAFRRLFEAAAKLAPCIVAIDELDSIPSREGLTSQQGGMHLIVNAVLEQLDGLAKRTGVVVVATCNHPDRLDPALVRPGRLGKSIRIGLPGQEALPQILRFHLKDDAARVGDLTGLAVLCAGMTGAAVEQLVREARQHARRADRPIRREDLTAIIEARTGTLSPQQQWCVAVHEAGHAIAALRLFEPLNLAISIVPTGTSSGVSLYDHLAGVITRSQIEKQLTVHLAGRAAEEIIIGTVSGGAGGDKGSDLARATTLALDAVTRLGLSKTGNLFWHGGTSIPGLLAAEAHDMLTEAYVAAKSLLTDEKEFAEAVAQALLKARALTLPGILACEKRGSPILDFRFGRLPVAGRSGPSTPWVHLRRPG